MLNVGFGNGSPTNRGNNYRAEANSQGVRKAGNPRYINTDELRFARGLMKSLNVASFDYPTVVYHFLDKAPGPVIENLMKFFDAFLDGLIERLDNDLCEDQQEYTAAITAKRIQEVIERYRQQ